MKSRHPLSDQWISILPNGERAEYESKRLASGKYWICANIVGATRTQSMVVDFPVDRTDVETVFLSDLIGSAA